MVATFYAAEEVTTQWRLLSKKDVIATSNGVAKCNVKHALRQSIFILVNSCLTYFDVLSVLLKEYYVRLNGCVFFGLSLYYLFCSK